VTPDQWSSIEEQFDALRELPPERQASGLAAIADPYVRSEVASLLEHSGGGETIAAVIGAVAGQADLTGQPAASILHTDRLGPYRLGRRIGHGGQGAVFLAVRDDRAFEKQVAIKILQLGADYPEARARFAQERQILAGLEHPYIARLLDGGETETGLSYFVLEFIDGKNILEYAA
jgi:serine/threonine protein kinase